MILTGKQKVPHDSDSAYSAVSNCRNHEIDSDWNLEDEAGRSHITKESDSRFMQIFLAPSLFSQKILL